MEQLVNDNDSVITLKQLKEFILEGCKDLPDNTPIHLNAIHDENECATPCKMVLADEDSVEFYNY